MKILTDEEDDPELTQEELLVKAKELADQMDADRIADLYDYVDSVYWDRQFDATLPDAFERLIDHGAWLEFDQKNSDPWQYRQMDLTKMSDDDLLLRSIMMLPHKRRDRLIRKFFKRVELENTELIDFSRFILLRLRHRQKD